MNSVNLTGRLTRDPELHSSNDGETAICAMRLAIDRRGEGAVFCDVKCFAAQAMACHDHLSKGSPVAVSGRLELDEWEAAGGSKRSRLYIIAQRIEFLGQRPREDAPEPEPAAAPSDDDHAGAAVQS